MRRGSSTKDPRGSLRNTSTRPDSRYIVGDGLLGNRGRSSGAKECERTCQNTWDIKQRRRLLSDFFEKKRAPRIIYLLQRTSSTRISHEPAPARTTRLPVSDPKIRPSFAPSPSFLSLSFEIFESEYSSRKKVRQS